MNAVKPAISFAAAMKFWLKLGFISFGGPAGQIAIMHRELVETRHWISERRFLHALNYCMVLPGPEAQQLATYLGWLMHGMWGGILAGALFVLPSLMLLIGLSYAYLTFGEVPLIAGIFSGIKPAVVAVVVFAAWRIGTRTLRHPALIAVAATAFLALFVFNVYFPLIIISAALTGVLLGRWMPAAFHAQTGHGAKLHSGIAAIIDDTTPTPAHATLRWSRVILTGGIGIGLWCIAMTALITFAGAGSALADMGWFFTKAALLTFGGAYAVLPYVYQGAVEQFQWLTAAQMIDGLALGESTPGPLIMIVAFVGYVGGVTKAVVAGAGFASGTVAACVATFFTFLPSFVFILAGGPVVESTRDDFKFTAPLTAITAAVVGVIGNLALFFAWHVFWPHANAASVFAGGFHWVSAIIAAGATLALIRYQVNVIWVLLMCGLIGALIAIA